MSDQPEATRPLGFSKRNEAGDFPTLQTCRGIRSPSGQVTALTMTETGMHLLSCRHTLKMVLGMFALSYVHMSIKFIPTHLKHSGRYFLTYGKNLLLEKFRCLRVFVCVYMRAHVHAVCVRVPKNKHGRLREGGTRTSHVLVRTSRMWRSSPPRAHRPL